MIEKDRKDLVQQLDVLQQDLEKALSDRSRQVLQELAAKGGSGGVSFRKVYAILEEESRPAAERMIEAHLVAGETKSETVAGDVQFRMGQVLNQAFSLGRTLGGSLDDDGLARIHGEMKSMFTPFLASLPARVAGQILTRRRSESTLQRILKWSQNNRLLAVLAVVGILAVFARSALEAVLWITTHVRTLFP